MLQDATLPEKGREGNRSWKASSSLLELIVRILSYLVIVQLHRRPSNATAEMTARSAVKSLKTIPRDPNRHLFSRIYGFGFSPSGKQPDYCSAFTGLASTSPSHRPPNTHLPHRPVSQQVR